MDGYYGNITFVLAAAAISCLLYLYLGITKLIGKSAGALVDSIVLKSAIILQFAIATVEAVVLKNNSSAYTQLENALALANAYNVSNSTVDALSKNISIQTSLRVFIICAWPPSCWSTSWASPELSASKYGKTRWVKRRRDKIKSKLLTLQA